MLTKMNYENNMNWIIQRLKYFGDREFLYYHNKIYTYRDLLKNIFIWQNNISQLGIKKGQCVAVIGEYSPESIFSIVTLLLNTNIIVPLANETKHNHSVFFDIANIEHTIEFNSKNKYKHQTLENRKSHALIQQLKKNHEPGFIIFSSGTTGESKAILLNANHLINKFKEKIRKSFRTMVFLKLDHIGGINTLFSVLLNGGSIVTSGDRSVASVCKTIEKYQVQLLPTTPTFLNMLLLSGYYNNYNLKSLQLVTYGTEPMPESTLRSMAKEFPEVILKQTYGLTELGIFSTRSKSSGSNWMQIGGNGIETKSIDGTLWIRSKTAMLGYLNAPSPFDDKGWYNTNDKVEIQDSYLRILGREQDIINVGGEKVFPHEIESIILELPQVKEVVVQARSSPVTGQIVAAMIQLHNNSESQTIKRTIHQHCNKRLERYKIPGVIQITDKKLITERFKKVRHVT